LPILPTKVIRPSFHILLGLGTRAMEILQKLADEEKLQAVLQKANVKTNYRGDFTGLINYQ